jgi:prephenate dehydrogenase
VADAPDDRSLGPIALLGVGLVGGSIARALRDRSAAPDRPSIVAWSPSGHGPRAALAAGVVDRAADSIEDAVADAALVVLAGPPLAILALLEADHEALRRAAGRGATVTDVASTKAAIVAAADRGGVPFVGGHPMAGRETSGFAAADPALFEGRPWVVAPGAGARPRDVDRVERLAEAVGAQPLRLAAADHDAMVAAVSHLPLAVAVALVEAVAGADDWAASRGLAAGGWAGMTRLALGDPEMGAGILATNREAIVARLRDHRAAIDRWIADLEAGASEPGSGADRLRGRLEAARAALEREGG